LYAFGVRDFEVASKAEIDLVLETLGGVRLYLMHPVKARTTIRHAYSLGVRDFAFDCNSELKKIMAETREAEDLNLHLRVAVDNAEAALDLSLKFGAEVSEAIPLLQVARGFANNLGVCFHVGSQCLAPGSYKKALVKVRSIIRKAGVAVDSIDVGGGFPAPYPGFRTPQLAKFFEAIEKTLAELGLSEIPVMCEPGRALVAEAGSVLAKVELRKGQNLYLNDGTYGALFDAGTLAWRYPARHIRLSGKRPKALQKFSLFGPTCDSLDAMPGPFLLAGDIDEGDWIEIQNLGGYGTTMRTNFNGFKSDLFAVIENKEAGAQHFDLSPVEID
jgi:ornithine decarboxylase